MSWYLQVLKQYAVFSGRARRKEYWMFVLVNVIISVVLNLVVRITTNESGSSPIFWLSLLYSLAILLPSLAVVVRRLHDTNRNGWWILLNLVPLIGSIVLLVWLVTDSNAGENRYGPNPKLVSPTATPALGA
jgi:uncharacterized membrane protein YhaH (DUF805 family)